MMVLIPLFLIVSFVFFMIASIDGAMFGTPEGEMDSIISNKMKEIINVVDKESNGELSGNIASTFDKI